MRLTEFYAIVESRSSHYTVEPDGSLLSWERRSYPDDSAIEDEYSYEVLANREDDSFERLGQLLSMTPEELEQARDLWSQAADEGDSLYVARHGGRLSLDIQLKADPREEGLSDDPLSDYERYRRDNPNRYF